MYLGGGGYFSLGPAGRLSDDASDVQQNLLQKNKTKPVSNVVILEPKRGLKSLFHADDRFGTQTVQLPVADRGSNKEIWNFSEFTVHFTVK